MSALNSRTALASAIALAASFGAQANEPIALGDVVVSASGFEQKITEAPASISVISREELQQKSFSNLAEALEDVEGIDVRQGTGKTGGLNISIRGMPSEYTLILIDGRRQNAAGNVTPNGFGETSTSFMPPLSAIERIEVIRGPMSTLYGSDAMGGVINIITRKVGKEWAGSLTLDHTYQETRDFGDASKASLYASGPLVDGLLGLQLRGSLYDRSASDLSFDNDSTVSRRGASPVEGRNNNVGGRLTFTPHEDHDFALDIERGRQVYNNDDCQLGSLDGTNTGNSAPTTGCGPTVPRASGYKDELRFEREQYALSHTARLGFGTWDSSLTHSTTETSGRTIPGRNAGGDIGQPLPSAPWAVVGDDRELKTSNLVLDTKLVAPLGESHITSIGGQWWEAEMTDSLAQKDYEQSMWALFAEDEWRLRDDLALTLGVRYDDHETFGGHVSPRAYLVWNTTDNWTLKGGVSRGYKTPDLNDLHDGINGITAQGRAVTVGNPDLKPETSTSTEIGAYFDSLAGFKANATLFHNKFKDKIATGPNIVDHPLCLDNQNTNGTPNPGCAPLVNVDEAVTQGLELASSWQFAPGWTLSGNYTYTDSEQSSGANKGAPLTNTPQHMAHAKLNWKPTDRLSLWFSGEYRGERARFLQRTANLSAADLAVHEQVGDLKAYEVFHLGGSFKASQNVTLNASIYNLFDKDFLDGKVYTDSSGNQAWSSYYIQTGQSTTGTVEEGRRLWLSAVVEF
ncbi:TonB-dependent receptor [Pseudomonas sp. LPH1]|nr:TonB-dependent receptor [Pseudomonas sp. LPH1]AQZ34990.1 TonB-dependent receptor [Pseudomonas sp. LPH1]